MKKTILTLVFTICATVQSFAHYLWIETKPVGTIGLEHHVNIYFGEYTYGAIEQVQGEAFPKVKNFKLWLIDSKGNKTALETQAKADYYVATFTPKTNGTYTIALNNDAIDVIDYTKYDFGIFKTHYHATTKVQVGKPLNETAAINADGLLVKEISRNKEGINLQVLYKNEPLAENELKVFVSDLWTKTLKTDHNGMVAFLLPWETKYIIETTIKEDVPGIYKDEPYEFIWHCATYSIL
ncbi:DUF4198 domain-containing protein [Mariniflexile ostreae]|uniref:DUF4198 domain-containing protein n=1 Tax=Mariniflexile ostreae TaxID=1520892 RepID=A0ABV5FEX2_9FLAO